MVKGYTVAGEVIANWNGMVKLSLLMAIIR